MSVATAIQAAKKGKRVVAVTVDPSRRLTSLLGLESDQGDFTTLNIEGCAPLDIYYVDPKKVFNEFVSTHLSPDLFEKLSSNGIYKQISKNLRETHNFAALYKMYEIFESDKYDLIILDTPPCHQVVDFFESPERLKNFFSETESQQKSSWVGWIQQKSYSVVEAFLKKLVGEEFVSEMDNFFKAVGGLKKSINQVSNKFIEVLGRKDSKLFIVFPPAQDKIHEAKYLKSQIAGLNYSVSGFILNRAFPQELDQSEEVILPADSEEKKLYDYYMNTIAHGRQILNSFEGKDSMDFALIPEFSIDLKERSDVIDFSNKVNQFWESH